MRFDVRYRTTFGYEGPVVESQNELRVSPATDAHQQLLHYHAVTSPASRTYGYVDYWGTHVDAFGIRGTHDGMTVTAEATVETRERPAVAGGARRADLSEPSFRNDHFEVLQPSSRVRPDDTIDALAHSIAADTPDDVLGIVTAIHRWVHGNLKYEPGSTLVGTPLSEVLEHRRGVCQDYAHLAVALCRSLEIPARYVSGYLFTSDDGSSEAQEVVVKTHAWFEAAVPGDGWLALDPTNEAVVGPTYITIGRGRDYDDVPPIRGTYMGPDTTELDVEVRLRRLAAAEQQQQQQQ